GDREGEQSVECESAHGAESSSVDVRLRSGCRCKADERVEVRPVHAAPALLEVLDDLDQPANERRGGAEGVALASGHPQQAIDFRLAQAHGDVRATTRL